MADPRSPNRSHAKVQRWLDLLTVLAAAWPKRLSRETLMRSVEGYAEQWLSGDPTARQSVRRTFERDKRELLDMGIRLMDGPDGTQGDPDHYCLPRSDFFLPYFQILQEAPPAPALPAGLDPDNPNLTLRERELMDRLRRRTSPPGTVELLAEEAALASEALGLVADLPGFPMAGEARSALRKLRFDPEFPEATAPVLFVERPGAAREAETVRVLSDALVDRRVVTFTYRGITRDSASHRRVRPWGLLHQWGFWYLVGWDEDREGRRVFRVGRIDDCRAAGGSGPPYRIPAEFHLSDHLGAAPWSLGGEDDVPVEVDVHIRFPRCAWAHRNHHGVLVRDDGAEGQVRRFAVRQIPPFLRWILSLEGDARVISPPEVHEALVSLAGSVLARHED